jgi:hypothetical protein
MFERVSGLVDGWMTMSTRGWMIIRMKIGDEEVLNYVLRTLIDFVCECERMLIIGGHGWRRCSASRASLLR